MKKGIIVLFFLTCFGSFFVAEPAQADVLRENTEVGITFSEKQKDTIQPPSKITPNTMKPVGKLPSTGELITSVIWILLGTSILIFFVGMISLKAVMSNNLWERVC